MINHPIFNNCYTAHKRFYGTKATVQTQITPLIIFTVWVQNALIKLGENEKYHPTPKIGNGLVLLISVGKSIRLKWLNILNQFPSILHRRRFL